MITYQGSLRKSDGTKPYSFEGNTENEIFVSRAKMEGIWYFSTNNGLVPRFTFNDETIENKYWDWKNNLAKHESMSYFYGNRTVD